MQDRIKQMAVEAGFDVHGDTITLDGVNANRELERLARGMARECCKIVEDFSRDWQGPCDEIRARFGIEGE